MPFFKTTQDIFKEPWRSELTDHNIFDKPFASFPPSAPWDYKRELKIEDVDIWEEIYFGGGGDGLYAAWMPYAEFYMITIKIHNINNGSIETFYGKNASSSAHKRCLELGFPIFLNKIWIPEEEMWLYDENNEKSNNKLIIS